MELCSPDENFPADCPHCYTFELILKLAVLDAHTHTETCVLCFFFQVASNSKTCRKRRFQHIAKLCLPCYQESTPLSRFPPQKNYPPDTVKCPDSRITIRILALSEWSLKNGSTLPGNKIS